jgi:hypothetical protein
MSYQVRLDETTIKNFVEVDPHSDSDATKIEKDTHTRSSVQPNLPTDELSSKSSSIRAVPEKLLVSSLVSRESTILQPIGCWMCSDEEKDFIGSLDTMEDIKRSVLFNPFSVVAYSDTAVVIGVNDETYFDSSSLFMLIYGLGKVVEYE